MFLVFRQSNEMRSWDFKRKKQEYRMLSLSSLIPSLGDKLKISYTYAYGSFPFSQKEEAAK